MSTDYSDIFLTIDGDIDLSSNDIKFISTNIHSLRQRLNIRFAIWQGEWKYNEFLGTPYREYVGKSINKSTIDSEIKRQALLEPDVERLDNFSSAFDRNSRLYSCSFEVETNEESISYGLVLKDSFEYVIPNYNTSCEKIIRYKYVTSQPYPILAQDYTNNQLDVNKGIIKEPTKETEATQLIFNIGSGTLRDILQTYTYETEYMGAAAFITGMTLTTLVSPDYNAGFEYMNGSSTITSMALKDVLIPYNHPLEDYVNAGSSITGMTLTGGTVTTTYFNGLYSWNDERASFS